MLNRSLRVSGMMDIPRTYLLWKMFQSSDAKNASFLQLLRKHQFVKQNRVSTNEGEFEDQNFECALLGRELLRNWKREWVQFVKEAKVDVVDQRTQPVSCDEGTRNILNALLAKTSINEELKTNKKHTVATTVETFAEGDSRKIKTKFVIGQFCHLPERSRNYEIQLNQQRFLQQFFNKPAQLRQKNMKEECLGSVSERYNIVYQADSSDITIQEITKLHIKDDVTPLTATILSLDPKQLFIATLADAYRVREENCILKLHPRLAPIKAIVLPENSEEVSQDLSDLVEETCQMLRSCGIGCWNGFERSKSVASADAVGAPFCVILPTTVFDNGLLYMRQLTTTIGMEVHMTDLKEKLLRYLNAL